MITALVNELGTESISHPSAGTVRTNEMGVEVTAGHSGKTPGRAGAAWATVDCPLPILKWDPRPTGSSQTVTSGQLMHSEDIKEIEEAGPSPATNS